MADHYIDNYGWDLNDFDPSTTTHTGLSSQPSKSGSMGVFYPYDIEEPEDELCPSSIIRDLPRLPDHFEKWQRDLVDDMEELEKKPTLKSGAHIPTSCTRGQKRKSSSPENPPDDHAVYTQTKARTKSNDTGISPKRRRQHSRIPHLPTVSTKTDRYGTSNLDPRPADGSSPDSIHDTAVTDEMEID